MRELAIASYHPPPLRLLLLLLSKERLVSRGLVTVTREHTIGAESRLHAAAASAHIDAYAI